jgi:DNA invertase Pin-like site-specific DNA recombinase
VNGEHKIGQRHRCRLAIVYLRQSTLVQVREHAESTMRQYALEDTAADLGWDRSQVLVLDGDLGLSGRSTRLRSDFKEVVSKVCQGEAGLVFVLEASRLSRNSADFQRLLEFCQVTDTLIADADGIYDLRDFNDQLLLGFKGTMSAVELHILAQRMQEAKRAAARRGELRLPLPIGLCYDIEDQVVLDPDQEVQAAVADAFRAFEATGSCCGVVRAFRDRRFPTHGQSWTGEVTWMRLRQSQARAILRNPAYAGAYVSGRVKAERQIDAEGFIRTRSIEQPPDRWEVVVRDHHPGYISWEAFQSNQRQLASNRAQGGARPPREGSALLQGVALCGHCGGGMSIYYSSSGAAHYRCRSRLDQVHTRGCRSVSAGMVDPLVERRLLEVVTPQQIELALAAAEELTQREARTLRAFDLRAERARYEASRAERAYHLCEPENRLVARSLEQRWEAKLAAVAEAEATVQAHKAQRPPLPPDVHGH